MRRSCRTVAVLAIGAVLAGAVLADDKKDPRRTPEGALAEARRLLEAKEYEQFLRAFLPPDEAAVELATPEKAKTFLKKWVAEMAEEVLLDLQAVKEVRPVVEADGTRARFEGKGKGGEKVTVRFKKAGDFWYLQ
ncbi:MAG TPA: hypothetical protein VKE40_24055 [Gemmataceae bacterium]|nr:hypothetical protein [Gemmataceae bacterium]